jgi:hypothetical protein
MNIAEYKTVSAMSSKELDNAVNRHLRMGFLPYGAPYVAGTGSSQTIYQALTRLEAATAEAAPEAMPSSDAQLMTPAKSLNF